MSAARKKILKQAKPADFQAFARDLGLTTVSYLHEAVECDDGVLRRLPRDLIGVDGMSLIVFRESDSEYSFAGWCPWHDGMFGGRYMDIGQALNWVRTAKKVRAGTVADFRGV